MSEVIGSVQVVVRPDTTNFAKDARKKIEKQFKRKNALELDFEVDPDQILRDIQDSHDVAQKWLDLKKNALKVTTTLSWSKRDLLSQLRDFKADVEALEKLQRPTVYANFEVDRRGLEAIREDIKLNVELDHKTLQRSIEKATKDITVFGDPKELKKKTESAAKLSSRVFQDILSKQRLRLEIDADTEKIEQAQKAMEDALGRYAKSKNHLEGLEGSLAGVTKEMNRQAKLVNRLTLEWEELESSGELNARQLSSYANSLREAEDALADMVRHERRIREERDRYSNNIFSPSLEGAKRLQREFEELERKLDDKKVEISAVAERSSFLAVAAELNALARDRMVLFWARVQKIGLGQVSRQFQMISKASGDAATNVGKWLTQLMGVRVLWRTFRDMVDWLPRLDMMVPQLAQNLALITAATAGAVGGVGVLFTLISDIGEVGKLIVGLPAVLTGLVGSALIVGRAIADFKDTFPEIISYYEKLGELVSDKVWDRAAGSVRKLHAATRPLLDAHVPDWATAWGDSMASLGKGLGSDNALGNLEIFLKNSILGTKNATKGWESLGNAIMSMVGGGSSVFPDLGTWFSETMADFETWAQANQGNLGRWLREGATALSELGSIGVSTVKIIAGVADAFEAAGWPGLTEAAGAMRSLGEGALELKNNDSFMQTLEQVRYFFEEMEWLGPRSGIAIKNAWGMIGSAAETLARPISLAIGGILDGFNSDKFQDGFGTFLTGLGSFITDVTPGLEAMTAEIGSLLGVVGTAGKSWGPAFNDMLLLFSDAGDKLHPGLIDFVENTGPALQRLVRDLSPHVEDFAEKLSDLLGNENFQEFATDMLGTFGDIIGGIIDLGSWIVDMVGKFSDWYASLDEGGQSFVRWGIIIGGALGGAALAIGGFVLKLAGWLGKFRQIGTFLKNTKLGGLIGKAIGGLGNLFKSIGDDIALRGLYLWDKLKGALSRLKISNLKIPGLKGLGSALGRMLAPIGRALGGLGGRLAGMFPKGGLLKIIRPLFGRFLGFLAGPAGWALLIASLIRPIDLANMADWIVDALGFEDTWLGRFTESLKTDIEKMFGNKSLLDIVVDNFKNAFSKFADGDIVGGLIEVVKGLVPQFNFIKILRDAVMNAMGYSDEEIAAADLWVDGQGGPFTAFWKMLETKLGEGWDWLVGFIKEWNPVSAGFRFGKWIGEKIGEWLFGNEEDLAAAIEPDMLGEKMDFSKGFEFKIPEWLQTAWENLVDFIKEWNPISAGFRFGQWIGDKIKEWLGIDGEGGPDLSGFSIDFDFSSLWENKIKPALKTGLLVLGGLIAAPGLILIAPLALPALIIGWLLGRDGEGNWSFEELTNKLTGAWDKIKGALESGVQAIGGFIGGLVMSPVVLGETIAGWIMGDNWVSDTLSALGNAFTGAGPVLGGVIARGVESIRGAAEGAGAGKTGPGFMQRLLGVDPPQRGKIKVDFDTVRSFASNFTGGVSKDYGGMSVRTRDHLEHMDRQSKSKFGSMKSTASSDASSMQSKVVGEASKMQSLATAKTAVMAKEIARHTAQANTQAVAQAITMQAQYVKQVISMQTAALRYAALIASRMPGVLRINLMPAGSYTGGTFASGLASGLSRAHSVARGMANSIRSALRINAFSSGSAVGNTFASGLRSRAGAVSSAARALASAARTKLPNSPAKEGPFAGSGWGGWGESIAEELARGMRKGAPAVAIEASRMMAAAAAELGNTARIDVAPDMRTVRTALGTSGVTGGQAPITTVNVNVESRSEDPLQDGNRFGGDIAFALRGAGLA